ncbi:IclR family transcriptional regulator C-terminal domain-containing protein [Lysinibacillus sp. MHQ-1]|nr:IclR family transcriptional regulator C-terminal domain-containing protein [Lysinibacillus sp. MHQ-1]
MEFFETLREELQSIRQQKWCITVGEYNEHAFGISVPLFNYKKRNYRISYNFWISI